MNKHVTPVSQWRKANAEGELFTLPGGNVVCLRKVHMMSLVEQGQVPDTLSKLVAQLIDENPTLSLSVEDLKRYADVVNLVVKAAFVEPKVGDVQGDDVLAVGEIDFNDRLAVFNWCHLPTRRLEPFRPKPG